VPRPMRPLTYISSKKNYSLSLKINRCQVLARPAYKSMQLRKDNYRQLSKRHWGEFAGLHNVEINSHQIILTQFYDSVLTACPGKSTKFEIACINRFWLSQRTMVVVYQRKYIIKQKWRASLQTAGQGRIILWSCGFRFHFLAYGDKSCDLSPLSSNIRQSQKEVTRKSDIPTFKFPDFRWLCSFFPVIIFASPRDCFSHNRNVCHAVLKITVRTHTDRTCWYNSLHCWQKWLA